jgi:hypothetical protein
MNSTASQSPIPGSCGTKIGASGLASRFHFGKNAYISRLRRHWIILDIHNDQYYCVPAQQFASLAPLIHGWLPSADETSRAVDRYADGANVLAAQLAAKGVLTEDPALARDAWQCPFVAPTSILEVAGTTSAPAFVGSQVSTFLYSCAAADYQLRRKPFESIVRAIEARRLYRPRHGLVLDLHALKGLVATFNRLRLWYPRPYLCLFDSLALLEFLARRDFYPRWIFGVTADPFLAHCWLQDESLVLNDALSRVSGYTPIMSV